MEKREKKTMWTYNNILCHQSQHWKRFSWCSKDIDWGGRQLHPFFSADWDCKVMYFSDRLSYLTWQFYIEKLHFSKPTVFGPLLCSWHKFPTKIISFDWECSLQQNMPSKQYLTSPYFTVVMVVGDISQKKSHICPTICCWKMHFGSLWLFQSNGFFLAKWL